MMTSFVETTKRASVMLVFTGETVVAKFVFAMQKPESKSNYEK